MVVIKDVHFDFLVISVNVLCQILLLGIYILPLITFFPLLEPHENSEEGRIISKKIFPFFLSICSKDSGVEVSA